jgi:hypothetical protein
MMPVSIVGMHRSGTSMVAHLLHECGLYLGPETDLIPPTPDNPDGHWENKKFVDLNDQILHLFGGGWDCPPALPVSWEQEGKLSPLKEKAESLLQEFVGREPWGWKDPRNCLILPLWLQLLPELKVVLCLRNPIEVALSLRRRGLSSYSLGFRLWKTYNQTVLENVSSDRLIVTHYNSFFSDTRMELSGILDFLNMPVDKEKVLESCSAAKDRLRHNRFSIKNMVDASVSADVVELYLHMCELAGWSDADGQDDLQRDSEGKAFRLKSVADPSSELGDDEVDTRLVDTAVVEEELLRREVKALRSQIKTRDDSVRKLQAVVEEQKAKVEDATEELSRQAAQVDELRAELADREGTRKEISELRKVLKKQVRQLDELRSNFEEAQRDRDELRIILLEVRDSLERHDETLQTGLYNFRRAQMLATMNGADASEHIKYQQTVQHIREVVRASVPKNATVLVVSRGDDDLLELYGRRAWHFPQDSEGTYAGYYPADSGAAIAHLEALRATGGDFLLFPSTALWWLEKYTEFNRHLERRYRTVVNDKGVCVLFALRESAPLMEFEDFIGECQGALGRDPVILDWKTGLSLTSLFEGHNIFAPAETNGTLPYLDKSIDVVALATSDSKALAEAARVAKEAVITITESPSGTENGFSIKVDWGRETAADGLTSASIILPAGEDPALTLAILSSLEENLPRNFLGEIIVVDCAGSSEVQEILKKRAKQNEKLKVIDGSMSAGRLDWWNLSSEKAEGEIVVLLDGRSVLLPGWLPPVLSTFRENPQAGAIGGKVLYLEGRLSEAGSVVFSDGTFDRLGQGNVKVEAPAYNYLREVDYCSGGFLATRRHLLMQFDGFDTSYNSSDYGLIDYCFRLRDSGFRTYYQPVSIAVQLQADTLAGTHGCEQAGQAAFMRKWSDVLRRQPTPTLKNSSGRQEIFVGEMK